MTSENLFSKDSRPFLRLRESFSKRFSVIFVPLRIFFKKILGHFCALENLFEKDSPQNLFQKDLKTS